MCIVCYRSEGSRVVAVELFQGGGGSCEQTMRGLLGALEGGVYGGDLGRGGE